MGSLSDFMENKFLDHLANVAFTPAATIFVALCLALRPVGAWSRVAR